MTWKEMKKKVDAFLLANDLSEDNEIAGISFGDGKCHVQVEARRFADGILIDMMGRKIEQGGTY